MKRCARCEENLPSDQFAKKGKWLQPYCKPCQAEYRREHYHRNREKYITKASKWASQCREQNVTNLLAYLDDHPCVDCGESDPIVLQFDHVRDTKSFMISAKIDQRQWAALQDEILKCEVRCANCHVRKTAKQFGWYRAAKVLTDTHLPSKQK